MGKLSRTKGRKFEQDIARVFRDAGYPTAKRGWQSRLGSDAPDIEGVPGLWIECKHHHRVNMREALAQAMEASSGTNVTPIAICRDDRTDAVVVLSLPDFIKIWNRL